MKCEMAAQDDSSFAGGRMAAKDNSAKHPKLCLRYKQLLGLVSDKTMPAVYRSVCCQLLQCMYLDREPRATILPVTHTQVASFAKDVIRVPKRKQQQSFEDFPELAPPPNLDDLQAWIVTSAAIHCTQVAHWHCLLPQTVSTLLCVLLLFEQRHACLACLCAGNLFGSRSPTVSIRSSHDFFCDGCTSTGSSTAHFWFLQRLTEDVHLASTNDSPAQTPKQTGRYTSDGGFAAE